MYAVISSSSVGVVADSREARQHGACWPRGTWGRHGGTVCRETSRSVWLDCVAPFLTVSLDTRRTFWHPLGQTNQRIIWRFLMHQNVLQTVWPVLGRSPSPVPMVKRKEERSASTRGQLPDEHDHRRWGEMRSWQKNGARWDSGTFLCGIGYIYTRVLSKFEKKLYWVSLSIWSMWIWSMWHAINFTNF
jgi:hypothetical protein